MNQQELFDVGGPGEKYSRSATAARPGTGPKGETCRTCCHALRVNYKAGTHTKCGLMEKHWTHGAATDIKLRWPACSEWEAIE